MSTAWWRDAVVYEIYPRSFASAGAAGPAGEGDLAGLTAHLDHLVDLGVDAVWITPFQPSPMADGGYDVADYTGIDPRYGDLADVDALIAAAHERGLKVTIDLVPNHCSSEHPWFQAALAAAPGSEPEQWFHVLPGRGPGGQEPPTNWTSVFGGPSWTPFGPAEDGRWYYHLFAPEQPDLNWEHPAVLAAFEDIVRCWLDRGVDGFRIDVADGFHKVFSAGDTPDGSPVIRKDEDSVLHSSYRALRRVMDSYDGDRMAVIETGTSPEEVALLVRPDEMHLAFHFALARAGWDAAELGSAVEQVLAVAMLSGAPATWVLENHDIPRVVTRYAADLALAGEYVPAVGVGDGGGAGVGVGNDGGNDDGGDGDGDDDGGATGLTPADLARGERRARAAAVLLTALPGTVYVYQGQELGLTEVTDLPDDVREDPIFARTGGAEKGRDGCRVPLPWSGEAAPFGFCAPEATPWLPQPAAWAGLTAQLQRSQPDSMLAHYRALLALRRRESVLRAGEVTSVAAQDGVLRVRLRERGEVTGAQVEVVVNTSDAVVALPPGEVLVVSAPAADGSVTGLGPDAAAVVRLA